MLRCVLVLWHAFLSTPDGQQSTSFSGLFHGLLASPTLDFALCKITQVIFQFQTSHLGFQIPSDSGSHSLDSEIRFLNYGFLSLNSGLHSLDWVFFSLHYGLNSLDSGLHSLGYGFHPLDSLSLDSRCLSLD